MQCFNKKQVDEIREIDLLTYLKNCEPYELVRTSVKEYSTRTHDSLKISNGKWMWWSRGIGGVSALDYLIKVRGKPFKEAMQILSDMKASKPSFLLAKSPRISSEHASESSNAAPVSSRKLLLPDASENNDDAVRYLEARRIDREIIDYCIEKHLLYQSEPYHNCIFLGFDEEGTARYAFYRSITLGRGMGDASGSDKRYSFNIGDNAENIHVFEGVLDLLSYATFSKMRGEDWKEETLISLGGVYAPSQFKGKRKLPLALKQFLDSHTETKVIHLHLDNDFAGRKAAEFIKDELGGRYRIRDEPPSCGKDYNEFLVLYLSRNKEQPRAIVLENAR